VILTVTLNPCVDRTIVIDRLRVGEIIRARRSDTIAGGKGNNVARVLKALGAPVQPVVLAGGETGQLIIRLLRERDGLEPVVSPIREASREVVTVLAGARQPDAGAPAGAGAPGIQTAYVEPGPLVTPEEAASLVQVVAARLAEADLLVLSGSVPCPAMNDTYARLIGLARDRGVRTILDTRDEALRLGSAARPDVLNCNRAEAELLLGHALADLPSARNAVRALQSRGPTLVTLTLGPEGFLACSAEGCWRLNPPPVKVVNPVGAGDALVAGVALGLVRGWPVPELLRYAQAVAAASLRHWEAGTVAPEDVAVLLPQVSLENF